MLQIVPRLQERHLFLQIFPGGACPRTPLESGAFGAGWPRRARIIISELPPSNIFQLPTPMVGTCYNHSCG